MSERRLLSRALGHCRVTPGRPLDLDRHPPDWVPVVARTKDNEAALKERSEELLEESRKRLSDAQELLYAADSFSLLVVLQGLDAAGKDGIIKHVMAGVNPQGCQIAAFKQPSAEELDHDFLWRYIQHLPERGRIGIFNRSHYESVLVERVHPEFLAAGQLPPALAGPGVWESRFRSIREFEAHLARNGTVIRKFFLNVSQEEQAKRLRERLDDPHKHWKFRPSDLEERKYWDDYMRCFAEALAATSTKAAPWYVIPADRKWLARALVATVLADTVESLKLEFPKPTPEQKKGIEKAKKLLGKR